MKINAARASALTGSSTHFIVTLPPFPGPEDPNYDAAKDVPQITCARGSWFPIPIPVAGKLTNHETFGLDAEDVRVLTECVANVRLTPSPGSYYEYCDGCNTELTIASGHSTLRLSWANN